ncbi:small COPII coat GTPase sar1 [Nemania abortiva]|nr:small COPII coat GTPase sar1 [Nemania abortiva]
MEIPHWIYRLFGRCLGIPKKQSKILILGLSGVGKSTLLNEMSVVWPEGRLPTQHLISEELVADNYRFVVSDLGGPQPDRKPWSEILYDVAGIIFLVDATDRERFAEAKAELGALVFEKETYKIPILVMGTGIDSRYAVSEDALRSELELEIVRYRLFELRTCSVFGAIGLWDGLDWLRDRIELRDWE